MTTQNDAGAKGTAVSPSWTWGSSARLVFDTSGTPGTIVNASAQLAQVSLPEPAICSFYLQAKLIVTDPLDTIESFTVNLLEGVGRVTIPRQITFDGQPSNVSPLEYTLPFVPVHALNVNVEASVNHRSELERPQCDVEIYFVLSPITRIPQQAQKLAFGMGLPGEADDLDDELRGELEAEGPTAAEVMAHGRDQEDGSSPQVDGDDEEQGDEEQGDEEPAEQPRVQRVPGWVLALIDALTERYGRRPTRTELRAAIARRQRRAMRRDQRRPA